MGDAYFTRFANWIDEGGAAHVAHWLHNYPIERGQISMRAPETSSMAEAVKLSRGPIERIAYEAVEDALPGFRTGWISSLMLAKRIKDHGARAVSAQTLEDILSGMGYKARGRAPRAFFQEDPQTRPYLFSVDPTADVATYGRAQGWE
jgi:hypothetical protein